MYILSDMKIQILISKNSWANEFKTIIKKNLKSFSKKIIFIDNHGKIKKNYDVNIIFSYFKLIPKYYLDKSKINLIPHESNLPKGKGMSPLTWQILKKKKIITFSLIDAGLKIDSGNIYYQKKEKIPKTAIFKEIKEIQLKKNLELIKRFLKFYKKNKTSPKVIISKQKSTFYKRRTPSDSELNINFSLKKQFNLLRISDPKSYPNFFRFMGKKYYLRLSKI